MHSSCCLEIVYEKYMLKFKFKFLLVPSGTIKVLIN